MSRIRVLVLPASGSPYLTLLGRALEDVDVESVVDPRWRSRSVAAMVTAHRADLVHVHWTAPIALCTDRPALARSAFRAARFRRGIRWLRHRGVPVVWTVHNLVNHERRFAALQRRTDRFLAARCGALFVHGEGLRGEVAETFDVDADRIVVVPHGNFSGHYTDELDRDEARALLGYGPDERLVLCFGQVRPYKGVPALIEAFAALEDPGARLLVAGAPYPETHRREVEAAARVDPRIRLALAHVPDEDVAAHLVAADVVALPFRSGLTSGSLVLAMTFGKPVVTPDAPFARPLVGDDGGVLYDRDDDGALAAALETVLAADPVRLEAMGARNRERAEGLRWETAARETRAVYERLLAERDGADR